MILIVDEQIVNAVALNQFVIVNQWQRPLTPALKFPLKKGG